METGMKMALNSGMEIICYFILSSERKRGTEKLLERMEVRNTKSEREREREREKERERGRKNE